MRAGWIRVTHPFAGRRLRQASLTPVSPRLACVKPVASVHPEPGSNSPMYNGSFRGIAPADVCSVRVLLRLSRFRKLPVPFLFSRRQIPYGFHHPALPLPVTACLFYDNLFKELFLCSQALRPKAVAKIGLLYLTAKSFREKIEIKDHYFAFLDKTKSRKIRYSTHIKALIYYISKSYKKRRLKQGKSLFLL